MSNLIRGEFYKLRKSKYLIEIMIFLTMVSSYFYILICNSDIVKNENYDYINGVSYIPYASIFIIFSSFIFALLGGEFIAKDFKSGNISRMFGYGYRKEQVVLSKLIVFILFCLLLEVIYTLILVIYVSVNYNFCEGINSNNILYLFIATCIGIMYNLAGICIIAMVAIITQSRLCTFISAAIGLVSFQLYDSINSQVFMFIPWISGKRAMGEMNSSNIAMSLISSFIFVIITIGVSLWYVKYKDMK